MNRLMLLALFLIFCLNTPGGLLEAAGHNRAGQGRAAPAKVLPLSLRYKQELYRRLLPSRELGSAVQATRGARIAPPVSPGERMTSPRSDTVALQRCVRLQL
jgi:hypothetical protein